LCVDEFGPAVGVGNVKVIPAGVAVELVVGCVWDDKLGDSGGICERLVGMSSYLSTGVDILGSTRIADEMLGGPAVLTAVNCD
jgi:hypothetical protein